MDCPRPEKWGISAELSPLFGGHRNTTLRSRGLEQNVVFKSTRRSPAAIGWLEAVHYHARQAGFIVPYFIRSQSGQLIEDGWTCETYLDGQQIAQVDLPYIRSKLMMFHESASGLAQRPGFLSSVDLLHQSTGGDVDLSAMPEQVVRRCRDAWEAVADRREGVIHGDLNVGNVLRTADGQFALIDWDEARRDLLLYDLGHLAADDEAGNRARLAWETACSWILEPAHARALAARLLN